MKERTHTTDKQAQQSIDERFYRSRILELEKELFEAKVYINVLEAELEDKNERIDI